MFDVFYFSSPMSQYLLPSFLFGDPGGGAIKVGRVVFI